MGDLKGLTVILQETGEPVGTVNDIYRAGNDLLEVTLMATGEGSADQPRTVLIPFVEAIVPVVDIKQGRVEITPPAGLID